MTQSSVVIRPVRESDLPGLLQLAERAGPGMTNLPPDEDLLEKRILRSREAGQKLTEDPGGENYLFVAVDPAQDRPVGTAGIVSRLGGFEPFYAFRIQTEQHVTGDRQLESYNDYLSLVEDHDGPGELNSLFVDPDYRGTGLGVMLSRSRFLYVAEFPDRFDSTIIAELRGPVNDSGNPPFWEGVTSKFIPLGFDEADAMTLRDKQFIKELMPDHPIYLPLLPESVRSAIGGIHARTEPAAAILRQEGFEGTDMVDIFDAGLVVSSDRDAIRTVRDSSRLEVVDSERSLADSPLCYVASFSPHFAVTRSPAGISADSTCRLPGSTMDRLSLSPGDTVRVTRVDPTGSP